MVGGGGDRICKEPDYPYKKQLQMEFLGKHRSYRTPGSVQSCGFVVQPTTIAKKKDGNLVICEIVLQSNRGVCFSISSLHFC